jgi:N6-adenosine-specific RNA methylase IME4
MHGTLSNFVAPSISPADPPATCYKPVMKPVSIGSVVVPAGRRPVSNIDVLCQSIQTIGLLNPISISAKNVLVAGRNRLEACRKLGWLEITASVLSLDEIDCQLAEIDENLIRNELSAQDRCLQMALRHDLYASKFPATKQGGAPGNKGAGRGKAPAIKTPESGVLMGTETPAPLAKQTSFVADTAAKTRMAQSVIREEVQIAKAIPADVHDKIRGTPMADNKTELLKMAHLPPEQQRAVAEKIATGEATSVKQARKAEQARQIVAEPAPPPQGPFRVIVVDPPWKYEARAGDNSHRASSPYPEMTIEQIIKDVPVVKLAHDDCILWLWTTNAFLRHAYSLLDAWGFQEKTVLTWVKDRMGLGDWLRGQTEHCILAVRGKPIVTLTNQTTALHGPLREHSRKPDEFYALVEALCPGSKVELFARQERAGWASWGAEMRLFEG